jgi:hypothetical protein
MHALLTQPAYQEAARRMAGMIARQDGRETAIQALEALLGTTERQAWSRLPEASAALRLPAAPEAQR